MRTRNSEINKAYEIIESKWVLTLTRKTQGAHPQHAFFILEGIEDEQAVVWFMDLVGPGMAAYLPNIKDANVRIETFKEPSEDDLKIKPLVYRCGRKMMDLRERDTIAPLHWAISKEDAGRLIEAITKDKKNPPVFNIFGKESLITASSAQSSSKERGHNCFTYAKEKIRDLDVSMIKIECDSMAYCMEHIAGITSLTLKSTNNSASYCPYFTAKTITHGLKVVAGVGVLTAGIYRLCYSQ